MLVPRGLAPVGGLTPALGAGHGPFPGATLGSAALYLSPPVTIIWAWAMFGEPRSWAMAGGSDFINRNGTGAC